MHGMFAIALMLAAVIATRGVVESLPHLRGGAYGGAGVAILGHAKVAPTASPTSVTTTTPKPKAGFKIKQSNPPTANGVYRLRGSEPRPHGRSLLARHTNTNTASATTEVKALFAFDEATKETQGQMFSPGELGLLLTGLLPQVPRSTGAGQGMWVTSAWENGDKNNNGEIDRTEFVSLIRDMLASKLPQRRLLARLNPKAQPKGPPPKPKAKAKAKPKAQPGNDVPNPTSADDKVVDINDDNLHFDDDGKYLYGDDIFFPERDDGPLGGGGKELSSLDPPMAPHELATMRISISLLANKLVSLDTVRARDGRCVLVDVDFLWGPISLLPLPHSLHPHRITMATLTAMPSPSRRCLR